MKNRLKLDFTLESARERMDFIDTYIVQFTDLTQGEAATIADYLLWGKDEEGNALGADAGLETRWTKADESESLDAVLENPALANIQLKSLNDAVVYRKPREVFDREKTRKEAPEYLRDTFENLWRLIDEVDLEIGFYEERIGKRDKPPREELLKRFSKDEIERIRAASQKLNQYGYLKLRRRLVELRREQFTIRDSYQSTFNITQSIFQPRNRTFVFDCDIEVLPLGLADTAVGRLIFDLNFDPARFSEEQLRSISKLVWDKKKINPETAFDFRNLEAVYQLYLFKEDIDEQIERDKTDHKVEANQQSLIDTLQFYEQIADLSDLQLDILRLKEKKVKNQDIADYVNKTYGKNYTANYISTIFRQKIIVKINEAAELHRETIENCFFPENFRKCPECGRVLLLDARNWIRKSRSKDGFQNKCKRCEKKARKKK
jgi:hypothetical protein